MVLLIVLGVWLLVLAVVMAAARAAAVADRALEMPQAPKVVLRLAPEPAHAHSVRPHVTASRRVAS